MLLTFLSVWNTGSFALVDILIGDYKVFIAKALFMAFDLNGLSFYASVFWTW